MAKTNYQFEKRQRDLAKKRKQEEKRLRKLAAKGSAEADGAETSTDLSQSEQTDPAATPAEGGAPKE
ncbi:MAG TPA: hypothetical protein VFC14_23090 [Burkholderiales bacterium]|nr:hypothetical protein [Burkholderiales bacterium]